MGRPKDEYFWNKISIEEDGKLKCKQCGLKFKGGVSRIKAHIAGKGGQGIRLCSTPPKDITSSNLSHKHTNVITTAQGERAGEMTDIIVGDSINYERIINSTWLGGERVGEMTTFVGDSIDHEIVIGSKSLGGERAREITVIDGDSINHERVIGSTSLAGERTGELTAIGDDSINHERVLGSTSLGVGERAREIIDIVGGSIEQERDIGSTSLRD